MIRFALLLGAALAFAPAFATPTNYLGELQSGVVASGQFVQVGLPSDPNQDEVFASFSGMAGQHIRVSAQANDHGFSAYVLVAPGLQLDDNSFYGAFPLFPTGGTVPVCGGVTCNWNPLAYYSRDTEAFTLPSTGEYTVLLLGTCFSRRVPSCFNPILAGSPRRRRGTISTLLFSMAFCRRKRGSFPIPVRRWRPCPSPLLSSFSASACSRQS